MTVINPDPIPTQTTPRPDDTADTCYDESWDVIDGVLTQRWNARPKTSDEISWATATVNSQKLENGAVGHVGSLITTVANLNTIIAKADAAVTGKDTKAVATELKAVTKALIGALRLMTGDLSSTDDGEQ